MDLREKQDIYAKHVMSRIAAIYQFTEVKNGPLGTRILKTQGEDVAESGTFGFSSFMAPLKVVNKIIHLIPGHALPL